MFPLVDDLLRRLEVHIRTGTYEQLESDTVEIKPIPSEGGSWGERRKSICAFLNTRGGILLQGIQEVGSGSQKRYVHTGYDGRAEDKLKELFRGYADTSGQELDVSDRFPEPLVRPFLDGQVVVILVEELSADRKFVCYQKQAYKRVLTGDHKVSPEEIARQEEYKEELSLARELVVLPEVGLEHVDLDLLNAYIQELNRPVRVETMKADLASARTFLERKGFIQGERMTTLGVLVCGHRPAELLGFRAHLHGYVDGLAHVAQDKQDYLGSVLQLMESGYSYLLRNTLVGISADRSGSSVPQYPDQLLRETINNALAHRDYAIDRQIIVAVQPGRSFSIENPGRFRPSLLVSQKIDDRSVRRILPEAKPRNPKLADVLRVYRKWEGRGIGMSTLVSLALDNVIDVPYYVLKSDEIKLVISQGNTLDDRVEWILQSLNRFLYEHTQGQDLTTGQKTVLAYLMKSEAHNAEGRHTIHLSPENNHASELAALEKWGLVTAHRAGDSSYEVHLLHRTLVESHYGTALIELYGSEFLSFHVTAKGILNAVYRFNHFSLQPYPSAKQAAYYLWYSEARPQDIAGFDNFYRSVRHFCTKMTGSGLLEKVGPGYRLAKQDRGMFTE